MKQPKVAIIICSYNQEELLQQNLRSIKKNTNYKNYKVFFVDDSGTGKIGKTIKKKYPWVNTTISKQNEGFSKANNKGIKKAKKEYKPEYYLLLNDDCEIKQKNWLKKLIETGEKNTKTGIIGCKITYQDGSLQHLGGQIKGIHITKITKNKKKKPFEVEHIMGAVMLIKKETINKVGLLDENYSPYLLEDTDYCIQTRKKGYKILTEPRVSIIHKKGKSLSTIENKTKRYIRYKNDIYFAKKNFIGMTKIKRILIYTPLTTILKKRTDEGGYNITNLQIRKEALQNIILYTKALWRVIINENTNTL